MTGQLFNGYHLVATERTGKKTHTCLEPAKPAAMGMIMGVENGKKWVL